jgi:homoserine O-succinyltransferase
MSRVEQFLLGSGFNASAVQVGLLNNMPDANLRATELQFARLLKEASGTMDVRLRLFSLGSLPRSEETRTRMAGFYDDAGFLGEANLDALIVTGGAPDEDFLPSAPYWTDLAQVIDWAQSATLSTLFSGAAATAAVLHLDRLAPHKLPAPLLGVYGSSRTEDDPLFFNSAPSMPVPHARRSELTEDDLTACGYRVLAQLENGQVDIFTRETPGQSRFVFLQGHPEYDPPILGRLHLKAMERFLSGQSATRPALPEHYFDRATEARLNQSVDDLPAYRSVLAGALPCQAWHSHAARLFGNWLMLVAAAKSRRLSNRAVSTRRRA